MSQKVRKIWIFGIGRFGTYVVDKLIKESGIEIDLVDKEKTRLENYKQQNVGLNLLDSEQEGAINDLQIDKTDTVLISLGDNLRSSILTCQSLLDRKIENIFVRVIDERHRRIIISAGIKPENIVRPYNIAADHFVYKLMHNFEALMMDENEHLLVQIENEKIDGESLQELELTRHEIYVILLKKEGEQQWVMPNADTKINLGDKLKILSNKKNETQISKIFQK